MRFTHFIIAIAIFAGSKSEELFTQQEPPNDTLLSSLDSSNNLDIFSDISSLNSNDDLFADSSDTNTLDSFELADSCSSNDGQPPARLRGRDGVCLPNNEPNSQPSLDSFINTLGIFDDPAQVERKLSTVDEDWNEQSPCPPEYPIHLCCESEGIRFSAPRYGAIQRFLYRTMENCEPVPILPICVPPRTWEVCCQWLVYPLYTPQIDNDLAVLRDRGNAQSIQAYLDHLAEHGHLTSPEGQKCLTWGVVPPKDEFDD